MHEIQGSLSDQAKYVHTLLHKTVTLQFQFHMCTCSEIYNMRDWLGGVNGNLKKQGNTYKKEMKETSSFDWV